MEIFDFGENFVQEAELCSQNRGKNPVLRPFGGEKRRFFGKSVAKICFLSQEYAKTRELPFLLAPKLRKIPKPDFSVSGFYWL